MFAMSVVILLSDSVYCWESCSSTLIKFDAYIGGGADVGTLICNDINFGKIVTHANLAWGYTDLGLDSDFCLLLNFKP